MRLVPQEGTYKAFMLAYLRTVYIRQKGGNSMWARKLFIQPCFLAKSVFLCYNILSKIFQLMEPIPVVIMMKQSYDTILQPLLQHLHFHKSLPVVYAWRSFLETRPDSLRFVPLGEPNKGPYSWVTTTITGSCHYEVDDRYPNLLPYQICTPKTYVIVTKN